MTDTCLIRRRTGTTTDPLTGVVSDVWSTVWSGPCKVQEQRADARRAEAGDRVVIIGRPELHIPIAARGVRIDDVAEITEALDPENVGRTFRIAELPAGSQKTARRFPVEEVQ